jgi:hypothetical protein
MLYIINIIIDVIYYKYNNWFNIIDYIKYIINIIIDVI